ncbi:823_t:CDS:2, partial [Scutellospora calospora]
MFKRKTTKYLDELESSVKKLCEIVHDEKEYVFDKGNMTEAERIIIEEEINDTFQIVRHEFQPDFDKRIEQESFKCLKRSYPFNFCKTFKRQKVDPKVIVLTGTIGVGKTTFGEKFARYLEDEGFRVYRPIETSLKIKRELDLFYKDVENRALFFQHVILETYREEVEKINRLTDYLQEKRSEINLKNIHKVIYIKPRIENMLKRQEIRNQQGETTDVEYLTKLYQEYDSRIMKMYPEHIKFENNCSNEEDHKPADCCFKEYNSIFKLTKDKKYVWIKLKDKAEKRELMRDKDGNYYYKEVNLNVYIYKCDLVR